MQQTQPTPRINLDLLILPSEEVRNSPLALLRLPHDELTIERYSRELSSVWLDPYGFGTTFILNPEFSDIHSRFLRQTSWKIRFKILQWATMMCDADVFEWILYRVCEFLNRLDGDTNGVDDSCVYCEGNTGECVVCVGSITEEIIIRGSDLELLKIWRRIHQRIEELGIPLPGPQVRWEPECAFIAACKIGDPEVMAFLFESDPSCIHGVLNKKRLTRTVTLEPNRNGLITCLMEHHFECANWIHQKDPSILIEYLKNPQHSLSEIYWDTRVSKPLVKWFTDKIFGLNDPDPDSLSSTVTEFEEGDPSLVSFREIHWRFRLGLLFNYVLRYNFDTLRRIEKQTPQFFEVEDGDILVSGCFRCENTNRKCDYCMHTILSLICWDDYANEDISDDRIFKCADMQSELISIWHRICEKLEQSRIKLPCYQVRWNAEEVFRDTCRSGIQCGMRALYIEDKSLLSRTSKNCHYKDNILVIALVNRELGCADWIHETDNSILLNLLKDISFMKQSYCRYPPYCRWIEEKIDIAIEDGKTEGEFEQYHKTTRCVNGMLFDAFDFSCGNALKLIYHSGKDFFEYANQIMAIRESGDMDAFQSKEDEVKQILRNLPPPSAYFGRALPHCTACKGDRIDSP